MIPLGQQLAGFASSLTNSVRGIASQVGGTSSASQSVVDTTSSRLLALHQSTCIACGLVVRSGIGSYDCEVKIGSTIVTCSVLAPAVGGLFGVSQSCLPVEGSRVLVYVDTAGDGTHTGGGIILGVVPSTTTLASGEDDRQPVASTSFECGVSPDTEASAKTISDDSTYASKGNFRCGRPQDVLPGEHVIMSPGGSGVLVGHVSTTVRGSELASVRCSSIDNQVRVVSGCFRHISSAGERLVYNDGGYITSEIHMSSYQPERLGVSSWGSDAFSVSPVGAGTVESASDAGLRSKAKRQTAKSRLHAFFGYLGDLINIFVSSPGSDDTESMDSPSVDCGLFHAHVDGSGAASIRSAGGVLLERYDRIPVPRRKKYPWDPAGDKPECGSFTAPAGGKPYSQSSEYPGAIGLAIGDMAAWWSHLSYAKLAAFKSDFTVPSQEDLKCPDDEYDKLGGSSCNFKDYDRKHSFFSLTPDGGIVIRDAWGSEIVMHGGRITLNAASNIEVRSGSSVVILGGDDVVAKAYNSVDVSATSKDVRIKAEKNLHVVSSDGGVLIQSKAPDGAEENVEWEGRTGEDVVSAGVIIKADSTPVYISGQSADIRASELVRLSAVDADGEASGDVVAVGVSMVSAMRDSVSAVVNGTEGLSIDSRGVTACATSVSVTADSSVSVSEAGTRMVMVPSGSGEEYATGIEEFSDAYEERTYDEVHPVLTSVSFTFRTTGQYGTDRPVEVDGSTDEFAVYQPSWSLIAGKRSWLEGLSVGSWDEKPDGTGEYPWPGREAMTGSSYISGIEYNTLSSGENSGVERVNLDSGSSSSLTAHGFSEYHIRCFDNK